MALPNSPTVAIAPERPGAGRRVELRVAELAALLAIGAFLIWATRGYTFLQDEWDFIQYRGGWDADIFLTAHNQHLLATDILVYKLLFATVGISDFLPYRLAGVAIHLVCVALLFEVARRRVGILLAAAVALPVAVLGTGWYVVLNPFNMQWSLSLAALLGIVLLLDRDDRRYDPAVSLLVLVALASSSLGVPVAVGVAARLALEGAAWRRGWVVALPLALYGIWFLGYGVDADRADAFTLTASPVFLFHLAAGAVGALVGVPLADGGIPARRLLAAGVHLLTLVTLAVLAIAAIRTRSPRAALPLGALAVFWVVLTLSRGYQHAPYSTQYVFVGAVLVLLACLELADGLQIPRPVARAVAAGLCVSAVINALVLVHHADLRRRDSAIVRAEIGALVLARDTVPQDFKPDADPVRAPSVVTGPLLAAIDRFGESPGFDAAGIAAASEPARAAADRVLAEAGQSEVGGVAGWAEGGADCQGLGPGRELALPPEPLMLRPQNGRDVRVDLRSFASSYNGGATTLLSQPEPINPPAGGGRTGWRARIASSGSVEVCKRRR